MKTAGKVSVKGLVKGLAKGPAEAPGAKPRGSLASATATDGCAQCPLRRLPLFQPANAEELALIEEIKHAELQREAGAWLVREGEQDGPLYTLLAGWAFRFKTLPDGRRQILSVLLPGDFIGLQQKMSEAATHGVMALTDVRLCAFARNALWRVHRELPSLGYDLTWIAAQSHGVVDDNLVSVGRRNALERVAALLLTLHGRAALQVPDAATQGVPFPLTQQHMADALGLSLVHVNRTLRGLQRNGWCGWLDGGRLHLPDGPGLARLAKLPWPLPMATRPLI